MYEKQEWLLRTYARWVQGWVDFGDTAIAAGVWAPVMFVLAFVMLISLMISYLILCVACYVLRVLSVFSK